jgi:multidrug transporter EmrE-like cation transporter
MLRLKWGANRIEAWLALGYATVLSLVVAYLLWNRSVKTVGGTRTAIYMCITPLFAAGGAWFLLRERPHPLQGLGAILIVAGVRLTRANGRGARTERGERSGCSPGSRVMSSTALGSVCDKEEDWADTFDAIGAELRIFGKVSDVSSSEEVDPEASPAPVYHARQCAR